MHTSNALSLFLSLVPPLVVILVVARVVGWLSTFIGQPRVVGEMIAGVLLGPTLLGTVAPNLSSHLFTSDVKTMLYVFSNIGLTMYMFLVGSEMEHAQLTGKQLKNSFLLAVSGILPGLILGGFVGYFMYEEISLPTVSKLNFCIFMGCALCITAFPMLARILQERGLTNTKVGSLTLVAASIDDAVAWSFLALVTALAQAKSMMAGLYTAGGGVLFAIFMFYIVKPLLGKIGEKTEREGYLSQGSLAIMLVVVLGSAWITDSIGIFSVFGGFISGLIVPKSPVFRRELKSRLFDFVVIFLLPIFFVYSGLNTDLHFNASTIIPFTVITIASILGKYGGCAVAMKGLGFTWRESSAIGGLMNARGLMELAMINIGISYGVISQQLYSILVFMAVLTTAMAMPLYMYSLPKDHELRRGVVHADMPKRSGIGAEA